MSFLIRLALLLCPADFRREYQSSILLDSESRKVDVFSVCADLLRQALAIRFERLFRNLRLAVRSLARAPVFVAVAVLAVAIAIGANVAGGGLIENVLLKPLPYQDANRLEFVYETFQTFSNSTLPYADAQTLIARNHTFAELTIAKGAEGALTGEGRPVELHGREIGAGYFSMLSARPQIGRLLTAADQGTRNIVISDELWRHRFNAAPEILGRQMHIDGQSYTVVGIATERFLDPTPDLPIRSDYWIATDPRAYAADRANQDSNFIVIGKLLPGVSRDAAQSDLSRIAGQMSIERPSAAGTRGVHVLSFTDAMLGSQAVILWILYAAVIVVFLLAASNVANMFLARATAREHELAVRTALGATRGHIAGQLLAEAAVLSAVGAGLGVAVGWLALRWLHDAVLQLLPPSFSGAIPGWDGLTLDLPLLAYTVGLAALFSFLVGLVPVMIQRRSLTQALNAGGRHGDVARVGLARKILVVGEIVLAFTLVSAAGLLVHSFTAIEHVDPGFIETNTYLVHPAALSGPRYASAQSHRAFAKSFMAKLKSLGPVSGVAEALYAGLGSFMGVTYSMEGRSSPQGASVQYNLVSPRYFGTLGIPVLRGRVFDQRDSLDSMPVAIISKSFAEREFGTLDVLGKTISLGGAHAHARRIVGVVEDTRHQLSLPPDLEVYAPINQSGEVGVFVVRTSGKDSGLGDAVYYASAQTDPALAAPEITSFEAMRTFSSMTNRMAAVILGALALAALILALSGIYGVVSYSVERRTKEFGIRMAMGAQAHNVLSSVFREALTTTGIAVLIGLVLSSLAMEALSGSGLLYETSPIDIPTLLGAVIVLGFCTVVASVLPAQRAVRVEPAEALRSE